MNTLDLARRDREDRTIARALRILERRMKYDAKTTPLVSPDLARDYLRLRLDGLDREEFWCVWLSAAHQVIEAECMSVGSLTQTQVYSREIVRRALEHNAAAVILAHNHPSGSAEPSDGDRRLTVALQSALALVDVNVLDHFVIGADPRPVSFAELGLL